MFKAIPTLAAAGVACLVGGACQREAAVYDGFETPALGAHWDTRKVLPGAVQMQSSVVRAGKRAARITLRPGDQIPQERGSELERAELEEPRRLWSTEDSSHRYSFSVFLPADFPIAPTRLVIAQWKQYCPFASCTPDNPILAIRYQAGTLSITKQVATERETLYQTRDDVRNGWLDFRFEVRFSRSHRGRIRAWLADTIVVDHAGVTAYPESRAYPAQALFYFKIGLYRDRMPEPMTIFVDEYRKVPLATED
jgi:hypothetical protein